jgi:hypothetical protein
VSTTLLAIAIGYLVYSVLGRRTASSRGGSSALRELSGMEA